MQQVEFFEVDKSESETAKRWIDWCRSRDLVKCVDYPVPDGILPNNFRGTLIDVKVQGTKKWSGPDDKIYSAHADIREKVARGNCVLELQHPGKSGTKLTSYLFLIFALRKFSGGMGDEDDCQSQNLWQNYFIKPIENAEKVVVTQKANGEAAHIACRRIGNQNFFCIGSKNVHMLAKNSGDVGKYSEGRFNVASIVANSFFTKYMEKEYNNVELEDNREAFARFLNESKYTCVLECLQPEYQHIENLSYLDSPELRFICWTKMYSDDDCDSLCSEPPNIAIDKARGFGVDTIGYEIIFAQEAEDYMRRIRTEKDYEGKVLYFMDKEDKVLGIIKKKTAWYIILRAIREKTSLFTSGKSSNSRSEMEKKVSKRIAEIQVWLGLPDDYVRCWKDLAISFVHWAVAQVKAQPSPSVAVRSKFPVLWQQYLSTHPEHDSMYKNLNFAYS